MRVVPIIILALSGGLALGAGWSWLNQPVPAVPRPVHGKGPRMLVDRPPADLASADGDWAGAERPAPPATPVAPAATVHGSGCGANTNSDGIACEDYGNSLPPH